MRYLHVLRCQRLLLRLVFDSAGVCGKGFSCAPRPAATRIAIHSAGVDGKGFSFASFCTVL